MHGDPSALTSSADASANRDLTTFRAQSSIAHMAAASLRRTLAAREVRHREQVMADAQAASRISGREQRPSSGPTASDRRAGLLSRFKARHRLKSSVGSEFVG